jgi:hypothetical protein
MQFCRRGIVKLLTRHTTAQNPTSFSRKVMTLTSTQQAMIDLEEKHGAHNYHPLPVVLCKGRGTKV